MQEKETEEGRFVVKRENLIKELIAKHPDKETELTKFKNKIVITPEERKFLNELAGNDKQEDIDELYPKSFGDQKVEIADSPESGGNNFPPVPEE